MRWRKWSNDRDLVEIQIDELPSRLTIVEEEYQCHLRWRLSSHPCSKPGLEGENGEPAVCSLSLSQDLLSVPALSFDLGKQASSLPNNKDRTDWVLSRKELSWIQGRCLASQVQACTK
jgi:hypothetical protein